MKTKHEHFETLLEQNQHSNWKKPKLIIDDDKDIKPDSPNLMTIELKDWIFINAFYPYELVHIRKLNTTSITIKIND